MKFVDLFCGIGTIRMGMEQAGHECVYSVEWDKHKRKIYSIIFGKEPEGSDICAVDARDVPRADVWCFGAPCQDFSIAGKRAGMEGERSSLVLEVFRLVRETPEEDRPRYLLYENVKGMLSSNGGRDFLGILIEMESLGYDRIEYSLLNSKDFGVPQNRERVFIIGHLGGFGGRKVFPIGQNDGKIADLQGQQGIANSITTGATHTTGAYITEPTANCLTARYEGAQATGTYIIESEQHAQVKQLIPGMQGMRVYGVEGGLSVTLSSQGGGCGAKTGLYMVQAVLTPDREEKRQNGRRIKSDGEPMFTLTAQDRHGVMITEPTVFEEREDEEMRFFKDNLCETLRTISDCENKRVIYPNARIRRLTPRECWRLQGIPDEITDKVMAAGISDSQMYRGAGDACTVNVINAIAERLAEIERCSK